MHLRETLLEQIPAGKVGRLRAGVIDPFPLQLVLRGMFHLVIHAEFPGSIVLGELQGLGCGGEILRGLIDKVEGAARVKVNGKDCGIGWKPPYQVDVTHALRLGTNQIEIEVANTWNNRLIGDEALPIDSKWKDPETLLEWPEWFRKGQRAPGGRFTFTTNRHYTKDSPLQPAGLLGPARIVSQP